MRESQSSGLKKGPDFSQQSRETLKDLGISEFMSQQGERYSGRGGDRKSKRLKRFDDFNIEDSLAARCQFLALGAGVEEWKKEERLRENERKEKNWRLREKK